MSEEQGATLGSGTRAALALQVQPHGLEARSDLLQIAAQLRAHLGRPGLRDARLDRGRLEDDRLLGLSAGGHRDLDLAAAEPLVPRDERVGPGWHSLDPEAAGLVARGVEGVRHHDEVRPHPVVDVAANGDDARVPEGAARAQAADRHRQVEDHATLRERVDVVEHRVVVGDLQHRSGLDGLDARMKDAAALPQSSAPRGRQGRGADSLDEERHVGEAPIGADEGGVVHRSAAAAGARDVVRHDRDPRGGGSGEADTAPDGPELRCRRLGDGGRCVLGGRRRGGEEQRGQQRAGSHGRAHGRPHMNRCRNRTRS